MQRLSLAVSEAQALDSDYQRLGQRSPASRRARAFTGVVQGTAQVPTAFLAEVYSKLALLSGPGEAPGRLPYGGVLVLDDGSVEVVEAEPARGAAARQRQRRPRLMMSSKRKTSNKRDYRVLHEALSLTTLAMVALHGVSLLADEFRDPLRRPLRAAVDRSGSSPAGGWRRSA